MNYILPGKIQTSEFEYRFSLYRRMRGSYYHALVQQMLEIEKKLRTYNALKLMLKSKSKENIHINEFINFDDINESIILNEPFLSVSVTDKVIDNMQNDFAIFTHLNGYSVYSVIKLKLKHEVCKEIA